MTDRTLLATLAGQIAGQVYEYSDCESPIIPYTARTIAEDAVALALAIVAEVDRRLERSDG